MVESQLLECLGEGVFGRHGESAEIGRDGVGRWMRQDKTSRSCRYGM